MALMDEFKKERAALKNAPLKEKISYFLDYYKWHAVCCLAVLALIIAFIVTITTNKQTVLYAVFLNSNATNDMAREMGEEFMVFSNIDQDEYEPVIDASLSASEDPTALGTHATFQKLSTYVAGSQLDVLAGNISGLNTCIYAGYLSDLRKVLTEEQLKKYEPYFLYADEKILLEKEEADASFEETYTLICPDPTKPEEMTSPIPIALNASACAKMQTFYTDSDEIIAIGIGPDSAYLETAQSFIDYIFAE